MPRDSRHRNWVATLNNPGTVDEVKAIFFAADLVKFCVFQLERGEEGTLHAQLYFILKQPRSLSYIRDAFSNSAHYEVRAGTHDQAKVYCSKPETREPEGGPFYFGDEPVGRGTRTDLIAIQSALDNGATTTDIAREHFGTWCRYQRSFDRYIALTRPQRSWPTTAVVLWGPSGTGKSRRAMQLAGDSAFWLPQPNSGRAFWDGYLGQESVVIDEFYGWLPFSFLLRLLDRYPLRVEIKGGSVQFLARTVYFTSNRPPHQWFRKGLGSLRRRLLAPLGEVYHMQELGREPILQTEFPEDPPPIHLPQ